MENNNSVMAGDRLTIKLITFFMFIFLLIILASVNNCIIIPGGIKKCTVRRQACAEPQKTVIEGRIFCQAPAVRE